MGSSTVLNLTVYHFCTDVYTNAHMHISILNHTIASCKNDLKLVGGASENEGRLEVCFDQRWGTINGDGWTHTDTQVACRQLGYSTSGIHASYME